jgi:hypothetical protein
MSVMRAPFRADDIPLPSASDNFVDHDQFDRTHEVVLSMFNLIMIK